MQHKYTVLFTELWDAGRLARGAALLNSSGLLVPAANQHLITEPALQ